MRILITGATGFVGSTLVPYLYNNGIKNIAIIVRSKEKAERLFKSIPLKIILSDENMEKEIQSFNPDVVIHLAAFFTGKSDLEAAKELIDTNILFTTRLLIALGNTSCKAFLNTGTFTEFVHGANVYQPSNLYSATKNAIRSIIRMFQLLQGWKWINVIVYSPYGRLNTGSPKVIDHLINAMDSKDPIPFSGGEQKLDLIHVDDMADFYLHLINKLPSLNDEFYEFHLGSGQAHSIREIAALMQEVFGKKPNADWGKYPYREKESMFTVAPISKNISVLGWQSKISLKQGLEILKKSLENNG